MTEPDEGLTPYVAHALTYWRAGWRGILALPANAKGPVPRGFTGWAGVEPSWPDVQAWMDEGVTNGRARYPAGNIALRLPRGVYGLDVDDYNGKTGGAALAALVELCGPLPATWIVSSRTDSTSGIRLFRADHGAGRVWKDEPGGHGAGIEAIHYGHRYAVTWPSMHPDTGLKYTFRRPDGIVADGEVPRIEDLPLLPPLWVWHLSAEGETRHGDMAGHGESVELINGWRVGDPCPIVVQARERGLTRLAMAVDGAALHPAARDALFELTSLGNEGHRGVSRVISEHGSAFVEVRRGRAMMGGGDAAGAEWWRMVRGAVGKLSPNDRRPECECDRWAGDGLDPDDDLVGDLVGIANEAFLSALTDQCDPVDVTFAEPLVPVAEPEGKLDHGLVVDDGSPLALMRRRALGMGALGRRPAPFPIVQGLLYRDTLAWIIGKSGSLKSFVTLDVGAAVAEGVPWAGRKVWGGPVLYVVAEGAGGMPLRVRAWERHNGRAMPERLIALPEAVQITGPYWPILIELAREIDPVLTIIDTQARSTIGVKENDNAEMGAMIERLDALKRATGTCVWTVHHIGRQGDDARGASSLDGAQDTELKIERRDPKALRAVIKIDKQKDSADDAEIEIRAVVVDLGMNEHSGEPISSLAIEYDPNVDPVGTPAWREDLVPNQVMILDILRELFSEAGGTSAEIRAVIRERSLRPGRWMRTSFQNAWNALLKKDLIERVGRTQRYVVVDENAIKHID